VPGRVVATATVEYLPPHYEDSNTMQPRVFGTNTSAAGCITARCGDAALPRLGNTRSTGVPEAQRLNATSREGATDANLSRGGPRGGRAVRPH
jgi:hypothetical protein